jgi:hypothetical protein
MLRLKWTGRAIARLASARPIKAYFLARVVDARDLYCATKIFMVHRAENPGDLAAIKVLR